MLNKDQKDEESARIAADLWKLAVAHPARPKYEDYKKIWDRINAQDEEFAVTCILKISMLIDAYTYQNPPKK